MKIGMFAALCMIAMCGVFLSNIIDGETTADPDAERFTEISKNTVIETTTDTGSTSLTNAIKNFFTRITDFLTWDYAFFEGGFEWIRWFILTPITCAFAAGFILMFASSIWGLFSR